MKDRLAVLRIIALILAAAFAVFLLLTLSGCHGKQGMSEFDLPAEFDTTKKYEITFWAKNDTNKSQVNVYNKAKEEFEALYPNVKVNIRLYTDYAKIYNDVITNISTRTTPNVCISYPDHIATYLTGNNVVVSLDSLFTDEKYGLGGPALKFDAPKLSEMVPEFLDECKIAGKYYAVPYMRSTEALYINKDFVEKLGYSIPDVVSWDWIWEVSEAALEKDSDGNYKVNGQNILIPFIYKSTDNMMIQALAQKGAGYSTEDGKILLFNDDTRAFLYEIAKHVKTGAFSTFKIVSYPGNFLNAGQCIFAVDSTAGSTWMGSKAPLMEIPTDSIVDFTTVVRTIPQFDTDHQKMISQGPSVCIFNKDDPQEVLASWLFVQYLLTNDIQIGYAQTEGYVPVTTKAQNSTEYQDYLSRAGENNKLYYKVKIEASKLLLQHTSDTFVTPVFNGSASLRDAAGQMIESTARSVRRQETIDDAYMKKLQDDVTSLYRLDQAGGVFSGGSDMGSLPKTSKLLLGSLAAAWVIIGVSAIIRLLKEKKKLNSENAAD